MCECEHGLDAFGIHLVCYMFGGQPIVTNDAIWDIMYALVWKSGHIVWRERWYNFTLGVLLWVDLYMTQEN